MRFAAKGKGKRGGACMIYYWYGDDAPIYALGAYGKNEKVDLKPDEAKAVAAFAKAIKAVTGAEDERNDEIWTRSPKLCCAPCRARTSHPTSKLLLLRIERGKGKA